MIKLTNDERVQLFDILIEYASDARKTRQAISKVQELINKIVDDRNLGLKKTKFVRRNSIRVGFDYENDVQTYMQSVAEKYNILLKNILNSNNKAQKIVMIRKEIAAELRRKGLSYPQIGEAMGMNHSTIVRWFR